MKSIACFVSILIALSLWVAPLASAQETFKIGAAIALSGSIAVYGEGFKKCIDLAVEEISLSETALYIRIVYSNWRQYQQIYR